MRCPACGTADLDLLVSCDAVAEEMELRKKFFASRIDGYVEPAQRKDSIDVAQNDPADIRICRPCGVLVRSGRRANFRSDRYAPHVMERMLRIDIDAYRHREPRIRPLLPERANVAEIGSYVGGFLHVAANWEWTATGIDLGGDTSRFARSHGYPTRTETLEQCAFDDATFDGIFVWNTFEQIDDPAALLREARRVIRPGGVLVIRTPNALVYAICEALLDLARPRSLDDHDPLVLALGQSNLLGFPHLFGFTADSLDRFVTPFGFALVEQVSDRHIAHETRFTAAARREAERVDEAFTRIEKMMRPGAVAGPWFEAVYRAGAVTSSRP